MRALLNFDEVPEHRKFKSTHAETLKDTLKSFLRCDVGIVYNPLSFFNDHYGIDIRSDLGRPVYPSEKGDRVLFVIRINVDPKSFGFVGIVLENIPLPFGNTELLSHLAGRLTSRCDRGMRSRFKVELQYFGNSFILDAIVDHLAKGIAPENIRLLCEGFLNLRTITFESKSFSTGLVVTRSDYAYEAGKRGGTLLEFQKPVRITPLTFRDNRFWFLADGESTLFLCNKNLQIFNLFMMKETGDSNISSFRLSNTLRGKDFALVTTPQELTITSSLGEEYTFANMTWRYRDFRVVQNAFKKLLPNFKQEARDVLLELVLELVKSRSSSMMWIPTQVDDVNSLTLTSTLLPTPLVLSDNRCLGLVQRLARSDGSLLISADGSVFGYGAIANLSTVTLEQKGKRVGSGSTAAAFLSRCGLSIKISQDGEASLFRNGQLLWRI